MKEASTSEKNGADSTRNNVERWPLSRLKPDPANARIHPERNIEAVAASFRRFGQQKPIVVLPDGTVVAGNGQLEAAHRLGWEEMEVLVTQLPIDEARAYALADNRTAELAEWNVGELLRFNGPLDGTGFTDDDLAAFAKQIAPPDAPDAFAAVGLDLETAFRCPKCTYEWSGNPKPNPGEATAEGNDEEVTP